MSSDFHWRDGWFFHRLDNGDVEVTKRATVHERVLLRTANGAANLQTRGHRSDPHAVTDGELSVGTPYIILERIVIPAQEWASIILSVADASSNGMTMLLAEQFHSGTLEGMRHV